MNSLTLMPFESPGKIYRGRLPNGEEDLSQWSKTLKGNEIQVVAVLCSAKESMVALNLDLTEWYQNQKLTVINYPIDDYGIPDSETFPSFIDRLQSLSSMGENTVVHCKAGIGRTGLVLACLAKRFFKEESFDAVKWVRQYICGAVETNEQKEFVKKFV